MEKMKWTPGQLLELSGYFWKTCALHAAVKLGVFTTLGDNRLDSAEVSRLLEADPRGIDMLLNALAAMDLLEKTGGKFANTPAAKFFLSKDSDQYLGHMIMHHHHLMESWSRLDQGVRTGKPLRGKSAHSREEWRESFLLGMYNLASNLAPRFAEAVDFSDRRYLLDLGGGPGTYAVHFCLRNPELRATVFDLPTSKPYAEKIIAQHKLSGRIRFAGGDYTKEAVPGTYDVAWLSHVLHAEGPETAQEIVRKAVTVLEAGGRIYIHDFILRDTMDGPVFPALFSLNMLLGTESGRAYSAEQIVLMLETAGARNIRRLPVETPNASGIITGSV